MVDLCWGGLESTLIALNGMVCSGPLSPVRSPTVYLTPSHFVVLSGWLMTAVIAQLYRQLRLTEPSQQQQTKWVVFGLTSRSR